jgi:hypothetical protein
MVTVTIKPIIQSVIMLNDVMLSVVAPTGTLVNFPTSSVIPYQNKLECFATPSVLSLACATKK